jgi:hypothetical protein
MASLGLLMAQLHWHLPLNWRAHQQCRPLPRPMKRVLILLGVGLKVQIPGDLVNQAYLLCGLSLHMGFVNKSQRLDQSHQELRFSGCR